jgi:hypothetical protein
MSLFFSQLIFHVMALQSKLQSRIAIIYSLWGEYYRIWLDNAKRGCSVTPVFSRFHKTKLVWRITICNNTRMLNDGQW